MEAQKRFLLNFFLLLLAAAAFGGLIWANIGYARQNPGGYDLIPRWLGTRLYIMEGQNPYSEETSEAIQRQILGRLARPDEDQSLFVYPFYSFIVFLPFALFEDFAVARGVLIAVQEVALLLIAGLGINLARWKLSPWMLGMVMLFSVGWYHSVRPVINTNISILVALFIMLALWAIREQHDVLAGFLLVLATIKPQMIVLIVPLILIWALTRRRFLIVTSFSGILALIFLTSLLLLPGWPLDFLRQLMAYPDYTLPNTPGAIFADWLPGIGSQMGWALTGILAAVLVVEWIQAFNKDFRWLYWTACLTLVITNWIGIQTATENYIALLPAVILVFAVWVERWRWLGRFMTGLSMLGLTGGLWWVFLATLTYRDGAPFQHSVMFFPVPLFLIISLYWVRHWAITETRPLLDELRGS
ncbi:MAG TPA: glycosyltransferase family 87 protein [Anaerolineales bacterium]|nr:glycosyltransferase family 87 protein [Anaerolineales bacterium]